MIYFTHLSDYKKGIFVMEDLISQAEKHWAILIAIFSTLFFLYKIRAEETLRTRLKLIYECYNSFALLNDAVQTWAHPLVKNTIEEKMENYLTSIQDLKPEAQKNFHQASILMRPETVCSLNNIFMLLGLMNAQYRIWKLNTSGPDVQKTVEAFEELTKHLPQDIQKSTQDLLTDCQIIVNGPFKIIWWMASGFAYPCFRELMNHDLAGKFEKDRQTLLNKKR